MPSGTTQVQSRIKDHDAALKKCSEAKGKRQIKICEQTLEITKRNIFRQDSFNLSDLAMKARFLEQNGLVACAGCDPEKLTAEQHILWSLVRDIRLLAAGGMTEKMSDPLEDALGLIGVLRDTHHDLDENGRGIMLSVIDRKMEELHGQYIEVSNANFLPIEPLKAA